MGNFMKEVGVIASAIVGLAIIATLVSRQAQTGNVIQSAGDAFSSALRAAVSPLNGGGFGAGFSDIRYRP